MSPMSLYYCYISGKQTNKENIQIQKNPIPIIPLSSSSLPIISREGGDDLSGSFSEETTFTKERGKKFVNERIFHENSLFFQRSSINPRRVWHTFSPGTRLLSLIRRLLLLR